MYFNIVFINKQYLEGDMFYFKAQCHFNAFQWNLAPFLSDFILL